MLLSNPAILTQCTGPALIALPAPPPGTNLAEHVKETPKVDLNVSEFHAVD